MKSTKFIAFIFKPLSVAALLCISVVGHADRSALIIKYQTEDRLGTFRQAQVEASKNDPMGQMFLGECYLDGVGVVPDREKGLYWAEKSANQGYEPAMHDLGVRYDKGRGLDVDINKSVYWLDKAVQEDFPPSQSYHGSNYYNGTGVIQNVRDAKRLYEKAAMRGDANGQLNLGAMYMSGHGVVRNNIKAIAWFRLSAESGNETAQAYIQKYHGKLDDIDMAKVEKQYIEYKNAIQPFENPLDPNQYVEPEVIDYIKNLDKLLSGQELSERLNFNGFSVEPPDGDGWTGLGVVDKSSAVGFYKDIRSKFLKSQLSTIVLRVSLFHLENDKIRGNEFKKYLLTMDMLNEGPRQEELQLSLSEEEFKGASCFRFTLSAEDNNAPNTKGKSFDLNAIGLECIHPKSPNIHVSIVYNQRTLRGKRVELMTDEANNFIRSVEFTEYQ